VSVNDNPEAVNPILAAALELAGRGIPVFPCEPSTKEPIGTLVPPDRDPRGGRGYARGTGGFRKATRDPELIREWWTMRPDAMLGIPTGAASGVFVIDLDTPKQVKRGPIGELTPDGVEGWRRAGVEVKTYEVETGSGGRHVYFKYDPNRPVTNKEGSLKGQGINGRGDGGYVVIPPSRNLAGGQYRPANGLAMADAADAPDAVYSLLQARRTGARKPKESVVAETTGQKFGVIFADPPWDFKTWSKKGTGRSAEQHYPTMSLDELKAQESGTRQAGDA
jgi:putative DNA primase/helicase